MSTLRKAAIQLAHGNPKVRPYLLPLLARTAAGGKWIQDAIKQPGALHEHFGIPKDETIPPEKIDAEIARVKSKKKPSAGDATLLKQLNLAKTLRGFGKKAGMVGDTEPVLGTALDYFSRDRAKNLVNKLLAKYTNGIFRDTSWKPLGDIRRAFEQANIPLIISGGTYGHNDEGTPTNKSWHLEVPFINQGGKPTWLIGTCVASGAGSVKDPLERYDLVAYVS